MKNITLEREKPSEKENELSSQTKNTNKTKPTRIKKTVAFLLCLLVVCICAVVKFYVMQNKSIPIQNVQPDEEKNIYAEFSYYNAEHQSRYEDFAKSNPNLSSEDVVWMVNSNQDKEKYNYDIAVTGYDDVAMLVNKYYKVPDDYQPEDLVSVDGQKLRKEAADAFLKMQADAKSNGLKIRAVSGYRSVSYQSDLYNRYLSTDTQENVDRYSARAGYSEHHTGFAVDVFGSKDGIRQFENTPEFPWVRENGYKYGFIIRYLKETESITGYNSEPWHLRYVGIEVSTIMKNEGIKTLEEYHAKYRW